VSHRIAFLPGDGIGPEVLNEARKVLVRLALDIQWTELDWGSAYWHKEGQMMPDDALDVVRAHDAVLLGAVGDPSVPDHISLWGLILPLRQRLDLWANVRPVRLLNGVSSPLAGRGPEDIDMVFVRENTEGEYAGVGGRAHYRLPHEVAVESSIFTRRQTRRIAEFAFELAESRKGAVITATKSNASRYGYVLWDEVLAEVAAEHPKLRCERVLVDALAARLVRNPGSVDVVVASNLFADILTDLAAELQGGLGMAASANIAPGETRPGVFEPVHGSAPDIAGRGIANPCGAIWSAALMLEHLGETEAAGRVLRALERVCRRGPRTPDVGGTATTAEVGDAVADHLWPG
jgi:tartrate dehydrogenase/decarboxylase / D-malate dehydrogenase